MHGPAQARKLGAQLAKKHLCSEGQQKLRRATSMPKTARHCTYRVRLAVFVDVHTLQRCGVLPDQVAQRSQLEGGRFERRVVVKLRVQRARAVEHENRAHGWRQVRAPPSQKCDHSALVGHSGVVRGKRRPRRRGQQRRQTLRPPPPAGVRPRRASRTQPRSGARLGQRRVYQRLVEVENVQASRRPPRRKGHQRRRDGRKGARRGWLCLALAWLRHTAVHGKSHCGASRRWLRARVGRSLPRFCLRPRCERLARTADCC